MHPFVCIINYTILFVKNGTTQFYYEKSCINISPAHARQRRRIVQNVAIYIIYICYGTTSMASQASVRRAFQNTIWFYSVLFNVTVAFNRVAWDFVKLLTDKSLRNVRRRGWFHVRGGGGLWPGKFFLRGIMRVSVLMIIFPAHGEVRIPRAVVCSV